MKNKTNPPEATNVNNGYSSDYDQLMNNKGQTSENELILA